MPQNPQNTISQTALKHYNEFRSVTTEALRWVQMTKYTGIKLKVETTVKERYQQLLDFITIGIIKIEQQHHSSRDTGTKIDTSNFQPVKIIHMEFSFYNVTPIRGFASILNVVCSRTRMIWVFPTESKISPVHTIHFILTTPNNEQHPSKLVRVDGDFALENSKYVTNLLVEELKTPMENTGGDAYWINGKNERYNIIIHNMLRSGLLDSYQHEKKWCCATETSAEVHICKIYSALENTSPHFLWYGKNPSIHVLIIFGCDIYPITSSPKKLYDITQEGSFMGYTKIIATMKWWDPHTKKLKYCSYVKFD